MKNRIKLKTNQPNKKISLVKALDLFLWHQIQVQALNTGTFSASLSLLKFGMRGCVPRMLSLFVGKLRVELAWGFLSPVFLYLMGSAVQGRSLMWYHQKAGVNSTGKQ
jgi:hypothetical protein